MLLHKNYVYFKVYIGIFFILPFDKEAFGDFTPLWYEVNVIVAIDIVRKYVILRYEDFKS